MVLYCSGIESNIIQFILLTQYTNKLESRNFLKEIYSIYLYVLCMYVCIKSEYIYLYVCINLQEVRNSTDYPDEFTMSWTKLHKVWSSVRVCDSTKLYAESSPEQREPENPGWITGVRVSHIHTIMILPYMHTYTHILGTCSRP